LEHRLTMNFKHNQKVRFNYKGKEHVGTHLKTGYILFFTAENHSYTVYPSDVTNLRPALKSFDDPQVGDVYSYTTNGGVKIQRTVLGVSGKVIHLTPEYNTDTYWHSLTKEELKKDGYTILQDDEEEKSERVRVLEEVEEEVKKLIQEKVRGFPFPTIEEGTAKEILSRIQQLKDKK